MGKDRNHTPKGPDAPHNPIWMSWCSASSMSTTRYLQRRTRAWLIPRQTTFGHAYTVSNQCIPSRSEKTLFQNGHWYFCCFIYLFLISHPNGANILLEMQQQGNCLGSWKAWWVWFLFHFSTNGFSLMRLHSSITTLIHFKVITVSN